MPANDLPSLSFAFFVQHDGGWWSFLGIHVDREEGLGLVEKYKHRQHCRGILAVELPGGRKIYEWSRT